MRRPEHDTSSRTEADAGERLVFYEYCISLVLISLRRPSAVVRLRPGQRAWIRGLPYTMLSLLLGWWCIPWGFLYTLLCLWTNLCGGRPITAADLARRSEEKSVEP
jgi:hypothetical protein